MLTKKQIERMLRKLIKFESTIEPLIFTKIDALELKAFQTDKQFHAVPDENLFESVSKGYEWGGEWTYCWFRGQYIVDEKYNNSDLFLKPKAGGYEAMLWVDGLPFGIYANKITSTDHGNHYCDMIKKNAKTGDKINICVEFYAGHYVVGIHPFETRAKTDFRFTLDTFDICVKNQTLSDFYFDLKTLNQMVKTLDDNSFIKSHITQKLMEAHKILYYSPENVEEERFINAIEEAHEILKECFQYKNSDLAPFAGIIGHSHMDTAWLWHIDETIKKNARTMANQLNLMEQYPEYKFIQSSTYHSKMIEDNYPALFEKVKEAVRAGRYEPNGGVWVECDCNMVSGEFLVRQFLWGQRYAQRHFDYTANVFWLPDTFGYSSAIPQIMKGCHVDYFLTTKMAWNDTNKFPYDTFYWQGLDGTKVLTHLNKTHRWPDPEDVIDTVVDGHKSGDTICEKTVSDKRLIAYGCGDGGGGPQFEMIEMARRAKDLEGCPKMEHTFVGDFMKALENSLYNPSTYSGELYLELHRGTLTNQHTIKRNNRKSEIKLRELELLTVLKAVKADEMCKDTEIRPLVETLLVNQFHDILPGTSIPRVHDQSIKETMQLIKTADSLVKDIVVQMSNSKEASTENVISIINTLPFNRNDVIYTDYTEGHIIEGDYKQQVVTFLDGEKKLALSGIRLDAFSSVAVKTKEGKLPMVESPFKIEDKLLETPFASIIFDDNGSIESYVDKRNNRQLRGEGYPLNTFLMAEDVPLLWDNWEIDADLELKLKACSKLLSREVISCGEVELRLRSVYRISEKSTLEQDMIFFAHSPEVRFESKIDWNDSHRLLKTAFDTTIFSDFVRQEIQFGYIKRPTTRNNDIEKAKFEVCNHKYTDLSESRYGVSLLNDCKYGISVEDSKLRLTLHKGGCRPDPRGDHGIHYFTYSFLPHHDGFNTNSVIKPSYQLNVKPVTISGRCEFESFVNTTADNIIIETVKPCEDNQRGFILRLYDCEGTYTNTTLNLAQDSKQIEVTNMLEETVEVLSVTNQAELVFRPFEIKTIKVLY